MNKCLESDKRYECTEIKLNCMFAEDVMRHYKQRRYGIKSCKKDLDEQKLWDLQQLLTYNLQMDLGSFDLNTHRNQLYIDSDLIMENKFEVLEDYKVLNISICSISDLIEKINSLMCHQ